MKTEEEMRAMFPYCPEACDNTLEIADKCYVELDWDSIILPRFPLLDPGETHESQFRRECEKGLRQHYGDDWATREIGGVNIKERFEYEYKVICDKGFAAYFLIVAEYVQWARTTASASARPWLGRRRYRRLRHEHYRVRPARERPDVREVPVPAAYRDARYRYGLRR